MSLPELKKLPPVREDLGVDIAPVDGYSGPGRLAIEGLNARRDDPDGLPGQILFPADPLDPTSLREDLQAPEFGLPRDLDGDTIEDSEDHSGDYQMLPVVIRVQWRGGSGNRIIEVSTVLRAGTAQ